ncbi:MAG TPA: hypothetical protein VJT84_10830 [Gaiellaceae bacterium]|nr:hypothetical protein [Gaiellaceae bacterium]
MRRVLRVLRRVAPLLVALQAALALAGTASAAPSGPAVGLKVLLLSATGDEPTFSGWQQTLTQSGVPFDAIVRSQSGPITPASLIDGGRGRYQAVILANGELPYFDGTAWRSALSADEWTVLRDYERTFRVRELDAYVYPSASFGLNTPSGAGSFEGVTASLTSTGRSAFPYLVGSVSYDAAWGYWAKPVSTTQFKTLVSGPDGSALLGVYRPADGREQLVSTVDSNQWMLQHQLLAEGMLRWVTRGVYLGFSRNYLGLQIDDVFIPDERWDMATNTTTADESRAILMNAADVVRAAFWERSNGLRLDLVFNGDGADGVDGGQSAQQKLRRRDTTGLARTLLLLRGSFGWINHTWDHKNLDFLGGADLATEIGNNQDFARRQRLPFDSTELVTGEHSGLANPELPFALQQKGIRWIASDASRTPEQTAIGPALTVPRYPTNVYYNVGTAAEQLDEYNYVYFEGCTNTATTTCLLQPATWSEYAASEAKIMLRHVLSNDPRPHYFHQSNLAEDGVFYSVVDALVTRYRSYFRTPLVQPSLAADGMILQRQGQWRNALASGQVTAYLQDGQVHLVSASTVDAPVTGTTAGDSYGGARSGWITLRPGFDLVLPAQG